MQETQDEKLWDELTGQDEKKRIEQEQKLLEKHLRETMNESGHNEDAPGSKYTDAIKNWMLDEWMRYTGYDATEDTYFSWDNEEFWDELDKELDKYRK